jgi:hypothetical protein
VRSLRLSLTRQRRQVNRLLLRHVGLNAKIAASIWCWVWGVWQWRAGPEPTNPSTHTKLRKIEIQCFKKKFFFNRSEAKSDFNTKRWTA